MSHKAHFKYPLIKGESATARRLRLAANMQRKLRKKWTPERKKKNDLWTVAWQKKNPEKVRRIKRFAEAKAKRKRAIKEGRSYIPENPEYVHLMYICPTNPNPIRKPKKFKLKSIDPGKEDKATVVKIGNRTIHKHLWEND